MLDPITYRASEMLAKTHIPSWRIARIHNLDLFERAGFPVRISSFRELGQIIDTMQENRFDRFMSELDGLASEEYNVILQACRDSVEFQLTYLPARELVLPISTLLSAFAIYKKMLAAKPDFQSVLELGPGCGYVSFFLRRHLSLVNYSQIEACESFYILQNLINVYCFGHLFDERAFPQVDSSAADYFTNSRPDLELSPEVKLQNLEPVCRHYPWWRIGEVANQGICFDIVTSNANLLEFSAPALDDYLSLTARVLKPDGIFLIQCTGFEANGTVQDLLDKLYAHEWAPLILVRESVPTAFPGNTEGGILGRLSRESSPPITFTNNNAVFVRKGHPLFERYYNVKNFHFQFVASESLIKTMFFDRPKNRRMYSRAQFVEATQQTFSHCKDQRRVALLS